MKMLRTLLSLSSLCAFITSCDVLTGPGLDSYRDVNWFLIAVDDMPLDNNHYNVPLGDYTKVASDGTQVRCSASAQLIGGGGFGWVEDPRSGKVLGRSPTPWGVPYELLQIWLFSMCGAPGSGSLIRGYLTVDLFPNKAQSRLEVTSIVPTNGMSHEGPVSDAELRKWFQPRLHTVPIADTTRVPLEVIFSIRRDPSIEGSPVMSEITRTFVLVYKRSESINERSSP